MALANKSLINDQNQICLSTWQEEFMMSSARHKVACCGRRSGKSTVASVIAYTRLIKPSMKVWAVATTYPQAKKLYFKPLQEIIPKQWIKSVNKSDLMIELINGSTVELKGAQNEDSLLGDSLDLLILDEYQSQNPDIYEKLYPMLADRQGELVVVGTPRGYNHFYDLWIKGQGEYNNWYSVQIKTIDAETISEEEIINAKQQMSPSMFRQEFEASFESVSGLVYTYFDPIESISDRELDINKPLLVGIDFNTKKMVAIVCQKDGKYIHAIDEVVLRNTNTFELAKEITQRYKRWAGRIICYPDPAGQAGSTKANFTTDHSILQQAGFTLKVRRSHPAIMDRINAVNAKLLNANGERTFFIHRRCLELQKTMKGHIYDKSGKPIKSADVEHGLDHAGDAVGYLIEYEYPIKQQGRVHNII